MAYDHHTRSSSLSYVTMYLYSYHHGLQGRRLISRQRDAVGAKKIKGTRLSARSIVGSVASSGGVHSGEALLLHQIVRYTICPKIGLKNAHLLAPHELTMCLSDIIE